MILPVVCGKTGAEEQALGGQVPIKQKEKVSPAFFKRRRVGQHPKTKKGRAAFSTALFLFVLCRCMRDQPSGAHFAASHSTSSGFSSGFSVSSTIAW